MVDDDDAMDAALFRFWARAASQFPGDVARALTHCLTQEEYRKALYSLAKEKRVNLPEVRKHYSDCAVHNEPALPAGECDCGGYYDSSVGDKNDI